MSSVVREEYKKIEERRIRNEETFDYLLSVTRGLLRIIGAWPLGANSSIMEKLVKRLVILICYLMLIYFFVPSVLYVIFISKNARVKLKIGGTIFICTANAIKYILLLKKSKQLEECFNITKKDWQTVTLDEDYNNMVSHGKLGRSLAVLSTGLIYGGIIFYRMIMPMVKGKIVVNNVTIRPLACPGYYVVFDEQKSPAYEFVFFGHIFSGFIIYTVSSAVCALTTFFVLHTCGQLDILIRKMKDVETVGSNGNDAEELIADIVLHQMNIRSFITKVVEIVQYMIFMEIASCMFAICAVLHSIITEYNNTTSAVAYVVVISSFIYNLFIFCYIGELLAEQQLKVIEISGTLYCHHLPTKSARSLILIILMSNITTKLTAGKVLDLSLSNFASVFKTTIGYFNILRSSIN